MPGHRWRPACNRDTWPSRGIRNYQLTKAKSPIAHWAEYTPGIVAALVVTAVRGEEYVNVRFRRVGRNMHTVPVIILWPVPSIGRRGTAEDRPAGHMRAGQKPARRQDSVQAVAPLSNLPFPLLRASPPSVRTSADAKRKRPYRKDYREVTFKRQGATRHHTELFSSGFAQ
jgi:hypothetical protein